MKKIFILLIFVSAFSVLSFGTINAQETTTTQLENINEGNPLPIGEEPGEETPVEEGEVISQNNEDRNQTFLNGVLAGSVIGIVVGAVLAWLFKDKIYK